jgi:hypothetical protein
MSRIPVLCVLPLLGALAAPALAQSGAPAKENCPTCKNVPAVATTFVEEFEKVRRETADEILRVADSVPEQSLNWRPSKTSPSVLEILQKIINQNYRTARLLRQPGGPVNAANKREAKEQVRASFDAVGRGVAAFPPGTDPGKIQVDMRDVQSSMREYMVRYLAASSQLLGELRAWAQLAAERKPAG